MEDCSGHSIINGLLSLNTLDVLETVQTLGRVDFEGGAPSNFLDYLRVSPLCWELLQAWSKYLIDGTSVKKSKGSVETGESTERRIVVGILDSISRVMEYYYALLVRVKGGEEERRHLDEFKDSIEKLGMLVVSKYSLNVYRHLNSTSRMLISSSLRLLASISCLGKSHRQEILHCFNFDLPSFVSVSQFFDYRKKEREEFDFSSSQGEREEDIFVILYNKRSDVSVRTQYLRFVMSLLGVTRVDLSGRHDSSLTEKDVVDLLRVRNVGNIIFKNSVQYDTLSVSKGLLFAFERLILNNEEVPSSLKRSLFSMTVINYVFNNLVEILSQVDLREQMEASGHGNLERYALVTESLLRLHMSFKTKERVRLTYVWFKSISRQIRYPLVQRIMVNVYHDLTLAEKMDYFESCRLHFNLAGESKLGGVLVSGFVSNLVKSVTQTEREELQKFISRNVLGKDSPLDLEAGVRSLANWVIPPFVGRLISAGGAGVRVLSTSENLFLNVSNLVLLISLAERLSLVTEMVASSSAESRKKDEAELVTTMIKQAVYHSFPEVGNVLALLRHYFSSDSQRKGQPNVFEEYFLRRSHFKGKDTPSLTCPERLGEDHQSERLTNPATSVHGDFEQGFLAGANKGKEEEDGIFINIVVSGNSKEKVRRGVKAEEVFDLRSSELETVDTDSNQNLDSNMVVLRYIIGSGMCSKSQRRDLEDLVRCKLRVLEIILATLKSVLKSFGNEFLLSMGYKFDNTRLILDEAYRRCYLNEEFLTSLSAMEYKELLDDYLYGIILYSLNIGGLRYGWNCNKQLLFRFLESLISIIKLYHDQDLLRGSSNTRLVASYLKSMWITIVSKLNYSRQDSIFYYLDDLKGGDWTVDGSKREEDFDLLGFQLGLVLQVNKTVHNYGILIRGFFEDYIREGKLSRDFLERNMDIVVLLLLLTHVEDNLKEDEDHESGDGEIRKRDLLIRSINLKGVLSRMMSELSQVYRGRLEEYVVRAVRRRLIFEMLDKQDEKSVSTLLGGVFGRWTYGDEVRDQILSGEGRDFGDELVLVRNTSYYYKLICETGFQSEFDISEIMVGLIREAFLENLRQGNKERVRRAVLEILELNYHQMQAGGSDSRRRDSARRQTFKSREFENFLKEELSATIREASCSGGDRERMRLLTSSFLDIYIKLGISDGFLFGLLASNDLDLGEIIDNEQLVGSVKEGGTQGSCKIIGYLMDTILSNISRNELVFLARELVREEPKEDGRERFLGFPRRAFLPRLLERLFEAYVHATERQEEGEEKEREFEWFLLSFVDLTKSLVDFDILRRYNVELYSVRREEERRECGDRDNDNDHGNLGQDEKNTVKVPIELFGLKRQGRECRRQVIRVFVYIMVNLFPYVYLRTSHLDVAVIKRKRGDLEKITDIDSYPIGYRLILILDDRELSSFKYEVERECGLCVDKFSGDLNRIIVESVRKELVEIYGLYREQEKQKEQKISFKKMVGSFSVLSLQCGGSRKSRVRSSIESGRDVLRIQSKQEDFWGLLDMLVFKHPVTPSALEEDRGGRRMVLVNSSLVFGFLLELYSHYRESYGEVFEQVGGGLENSGICEAVYLGYLLHYNDLEEGLNGYHISDAEGMTVSILAECYSSVLKRFQSVVSKYEQDEMKDADIVLIYYYYMILIPVIMDKLNNPIYYCIRSNLSQLKEDLGSREARSLGFVLSYSPNESFYRLLGKIGEMSEYRCKYPIAFIESSKVFINMSRKVLDDYKKKRESGGVEKLDLLLSMLLASTLYVAKMQQMRSFQYRRSIYNKMGSFVLLKLNRIAVFLNALHQILFEYLATCREDAEVDNNARSLMVVFIFVEYLLLLRESGDGGKSALSLDSDEGISEEYVLDFLNTTKIGQFSSTRDCLYYKVLNESKREKEEDGRGSCPDECFGIDGREFKNLVLTNHNVFLVNSKLKDILKLEEKSEISVPVVNTINEVSESNSMNLKDRIRLTRYWYHYYSIYLNNNCIDFETRQVSVFNWLSPDLKRLRRTLDNFPYNSKLVSNCDLTFGSKSVDDLGYNLGFILPIINSKFKLAYSILRERGFQNSKNKDQDQDQDQDRDLDHENGENVRTCSGFVQDYDQLSKSRFFNKVIDNNFIWLRNFCKNGSLQILVNSLSCTDISLRYYSYQTLSLLFEIISFHYHKYLQKLKKQEEEKDEEQEDEVEDEEQEEKFMNKKERNRKRMRTKRKHRHVRYIFRELPQLFMILNTLKNTVSGTVVGESKDSGGAREDVEFGSRHEDCIRLSSFVTRFVSDSIDIVFEPESKLFKKVNYFILSRSFLDRYDIPLIINFLYSEEPEDSSVYKSFILSELRASVGILRFLRNAQGLELEQEHDSINRRFVFPLLLNYVKTNNIYSQHDYFENTAQILSIILGMIDNRESNIVYHNFENKEDPNFDPDEKPCDESKQGAKRTINNSLVFPNPTVKILLKDVPVSKGSSTDNNLPSSVNLILQMVHQHSLLDFIRNLVQQLSMSSQSKLSNSKHFKEILQLLARILLVITRNIFNYDESYVSKAPAALIRLKYYHNDNLNKTILRFLGGYSNSYWVFQKLLSCLKLLSSSKISNLLGPKVSPFDTVYRIWLNSYLGLLYCKRYLFHQIDSVHFYHELIINYQEFHSKFLRHHSGPHIRNHH